MSIRSLLTGSACLLVLYFNQSSTVLAKDTASVKPEQIAELYLSGFVNQDIEKIKKLNMILRPAYSGEDSIKVDAISTLGKDVAEGLTNTNLKKIPEKDRSKLKAYFLKVNEATVLASKRSVCRTTGTKIADNDVIKGRKIATVSYECQIVDAVPGFNALKEREKPSKDALITPAFLDSVVKILNEAPLNRRMSGEMYLSHADEKNTLWYTGNPGEAYSEVLGAVAKQLQIFEAE